MITVCRGDVSLGGVSGFGTRGIFAVLARALFRACPRCMGGHENTGGALDRFHRDPAVDLQPDRAIPDQFPGPADLRQHEVKEFLPAESGFDGHEQHHVQFIEHLGVGLDRGGGSLDRKSVV